MLWFSVILSIFRDLLQLKALLLKRDVHTVLELLLLLM